jgi:hypothetical protein
MENAVTRSLSFGNPTMRYTTCAKQAVTNSKSAGGTVMTYSRMKGLAFIVLTLLERPQHTVQKIVNHHVPDIG